MPAPLTITQHELDTRPLQYIPSPHYATLKATLSAAVHAAAEPKKMDLIEAYAFFLANSLSVEVVA
jgi:hypothetical protein